jgi:pantoate--beta-alanine ligase
MEILHDPASLRKYVAQKRQSHAPIGFVPTMGALHNGHISLIKKSLESCQLTIASIFVNPTQFNDPNDFLKYPSTLDTDLEMLIHAGCDAVFVPQVSDMYPKGVESDKKTMDLGYLGQCMEGAKRPGHFDGVVQVVYLLLDMVHPDVLFLGAKDIQQVKVISRMIQHFQLPVSVVTVPTVREADGLAMSSRNMRLNAQQRQKAPRLYETLSAISNMYGKEEPSVLTKSYIDQLNQTPGILVDYLEIVDSQSLMPLEKWNEKGQNLVCIAAFMGDIRLIDNLLF